MYAGAGEGVGVAVGFGVGVDVGTVTDGFVVSATKIAMTVTSPAGMINLPSALMLTSSETQRFNP